jgi:hypothetical protein
MSTTPNINPIEFENFVLTAAAPRNPKPAVGEFVRVLEADEDFEVSLNRSSTAFPIGRNGFFRMPRDASGRQMQFEHIEFRRKSTATVASNAITVIVGSGDYETGNVSLVANVTTESAATLETAADLVLVAATNTLVFAANSSARVRRIRNSSTTDSVRLATAEADLSAGEGDLLNPGEVIELFVTGAIYARSAGTPTLVRAEEVY